MDLSCYKILEHIFIGSSIMLLLMCFAWSGATRRFSVVSIALYFLMRSLGLLADIDVSLFSFITDNIDLIKIEASFYTAFSSLILIYFINLLIVFRKSLYRRICLVFAIIVCAILLLSYFIPSTNIWLSNQVLMTGTNLLLAFIVFQQKLEQNDILKLFFGAVIVQLCFNFTFIALHYISTDMLLINALEMVSFGVIVTLVTYQVGRNYFFHVEDEKLTHQQLVLSMQASKKAQEELLLAQQENQEQLESSVQERTIELNIALQELEEANHELREKNTLDELTGLYNRRFYDQKILAEYRRSRRNLTPLSLVIVDIDHFKTVNDTYGHLAGDKCLIEVALVIKSLLQRSADVGCRYGGEEFCLILPETDTEGAIALAQEIREKIKAQKVMIDNDIIDLSASCGVSTYQQEKDATTDNIFASADKALYQAKQAGRNQVKFCGINTD